MTFTGGSGAYSYHRSDRWLKGLLLRIHGIVYYVDQATLIEPQTTNGGVSAIDGAIDAVPEPAFSTFTGIGFAGLLLIYFRRSRQKRLAA